MSSHAGKQGKGEVTRMSDVNGFADLLQLVLFNFLARAGNWQSKATMTPLFDVKEQKIER